MMTGLTAEQTYIYYTKDRVNAVATPKNTRLFIDTPLKHNGIGFGMKFVGRANKCLICNEYFMESAIEHCCGEEHHTQLAALIKKKEIETAILKTHPDDCEIPEDIPGGECTISSQAIPTNMITTGEQESLVARPLIETERKLSKYRIVYCLKRWRMCMVMCTFTNMNTNACDQIKLMLMIFLSCLQSLISVLFLTCISHC
jgi:hypothetical protein